MQLRLDADEMTGWGAGNEAEHARQAADEIDRLRAELAAKPPAGISLARYMEARANDAEYRNKLWAMIQDMRAALFAVPVTACTEGWWALYGRRIDDLRVADPTP